MKPNKRLLKSLRDIQSWACGGMKPRAAEINDFIGGNGRIGAVSIQIFLEGMQNIGSGLQQADHKVSMKPQKQFAMGNLKILTANSLTILASKETLKTGIDDLDGLTQVMMCGLATGQLGLIEPFHQTVFAGLNGGYGIRDGHNLPIGTTLRYAAFGLTIIGDWLGKPLDLDKHALPRDPAWGQLVAHWREPDPEKLLPILLDACDTHVERIALNSRELDSGNFEFGSPFEAVYPAEILAIKNLRLSLGLQTPFIDHPLMKSPYAMLTLPPNTPLEHDELLEQFLKAACRYNPEAVPEGLYEAVRETGAIG
ncbi:hypothetical protein [uncultured Pseudomonas sp.]|uniref:hypothetical protein n=1 Tax=uncultured Pseudomonas sp. TaxID=114707 RepID=UPI0025E84B27|nr:hypothetical protein [uncultured Pseudomonas sp.]